MEGCQEAHQGVVVEETGRPMTTLPPKQAPHRSRGILEMSPILLPGRL
jgi:hypothetical protein